MASTGHIARSDSSTSSSLTGDGARHAVATEPKSSKDPSSPRQLMLGLGFGVIFGFLLQKGGVAKYHILMGVLLLEDATVVKVMLSAIAVGMVGVFSMNRLGLVKLHLKPTRYAANIVGGLLFGVGFGVMGYCPGTGAAALGQGNYDAAFGILGLLAGSYLFAEASAKLDKTLMKWGDRGKLMLPELLRIPTLPFAFAFAAAIGLLLLVA